MDLSNKLSSNEILRDSKRFKRLFFFRMCGTGMGAAACLMKERGYDVEGADTFFYPPMSDYLKRTGIPCHDLHQVKKEFLQSFDLIVVGNVVGRESDDARLIESLGVPFASFPAALGALVLKDVNVVGIAGTHGKTTTTWLATQVFRNLGEDPGYLVGGVIENQASAHSGNGRYFFIESDEYDSAYFEKIAKFRLYYLKNLILTSLEFDHADIYSGVDAIEKEFREVIPCVPSKVIINSGYESCRKFFREYNGEANRLWELYGEDTNIGPHSIRSRANGSSFAMVLGGHETIFETNLIGRHNIWNLSAVILFAFMEGFSVEHLRVAVKKLGMVKRRQEERGRYHEALIVEDFAHHPTAVALTIEAVRAQYPGKKIIAVLEPNSATSRSSLFETEFANALSASDGVILVRPSRHSSIKNHGDIDLKAMGEVISGKKDITVLVVDSLLSLRESIDKFAVKNTVILIMSNSTCFGLWESDFVSALEK